MIPNTPRRHEHWSSKKYTTNGCHCNVAHLLTQIHRKNIFQKRTYLKTLEKGHNIVCRHAWHHSNCWNTKNDFIRKCFLGKTFIITKYDSKIVHMILGGSNHDNNIWTMWIKSRYKLFSTITL